MSITGRCNCSSINVTIPTPEGSVVCYCTNCQRTSAGLCSINYILDTSSAKFDDPKDLLKSYKDSDTKSGNVITRKFCSNCGCPIATLLGDNAPKIVIKTGLFDGPAKEPAMELFTEDKAAWMKIVKGDAEKTKLS